VNVWLRIELDVIERYPAQAICKKGIIWLLEELFVENIFEKQEDTI